MKRFFMLVCSMIAFVAVSQPAEAKKRKWLCDSCTAYAHTQCPKKGKLCIAKHYSKCYLKVRKSCAKAGSISCPKKAATMKFKNALTRKWWLNRCRSAARKSCRARKCAVPKK